ncbi:MAG: hypothetical protein ACKOTE_08325 [Opitutaceae bacterium]
MPHNESPAHLRLKALAFEWAQDSGLRIIASEVSLPKSRFRADLVALEPENRGKTAIFECKQARSDLLKDSHDSASTRAEFEDLTSRLRDLERLIGEHRPDLRKGDSLFPEFDSVDLSATRHASYRRVLSELATRQARLLRGTKFSQLFRWRSADLFYLVSEPGIFAPAEVPAGWGLLVRDGDRLLLERRPVEVDSGQEARDRLLRAVALAGTRATAKTLG